MAVVVSKRGETRTSRAADWPGPPPVPWRGRGSMGCGVAKGVELARGEGKWIEADGTLILPIWACRNIVHAGVRTHVNAV